MVKFGCASSRIPWDKLKFDLVYGQTEGDEEEKKSLLNDLDSNFDRADNGYYEIEFEEVFRVMIGRLIDVQKKGSEGKCR